MFNDLLASLPHVHVRQRRQWDVASFVAATAALSLATYNTVQISKLETAIEVQQAKTDLLTDISKLHEQHLHQLQGQINDIGQEIQVVKLFAGWQIRIDRIVAQISSDDAKQIGRLSDLLTDERIGALMERVPRKENGYWGCDLKGVRPKDRPVVFYSFVRFRALELGSNTAPFRFQLK